MASSSGAFQTNVHRQKTRKWVEAKVANYDGDDWGDDGDEDGEDEDAGPGAPPPPLPLPRQATMPALPRLQHHQQLHQQRQQQQEKQQEKPPSPPAKAMTAPPDAASRLSAASPHDRQTTTQTQTRSPPDDRPPQPQSRPLYAEPALPPHHRQPRSSSTSPIPHASSTSPMPHAARPPLRSASTSPAVPPSTDPPHSSSRPPSASASSPPAAPPPGPPPAAALPPRSVSINAPVKSHALPIHPNTAAAAQDDPRSAPEPSPLHLAAPVPSKPLSSMALRSDHSGPLASFEVHANQGPAQQRGSSTSPRLPDVARMSMFTVDFNKSYTSDAASAPPMPALPPLAVNKDERPAPADLPRDPAAADRNSDASSSVAPPSLAPPLGPTAANASPATSSILTASPTKESDRLREEILQSLGPPKHRNTASSVSEQSSLRQSTRDSKYLSNIYGEYWPAAGEDGGDSGTVSASIGLGINNGPPDSIVVAPLSNRKSQLLDMMMSTEKISVAHEASHVQAEQTQRESDSNKEVVTDQPNLGGPRRFSWEAPMPAAQPAETSASASLPRDSSAPMPVPLEGFSDEKETDFGVSSALSVPPLATPRASSDSLPQVVSDQPRSEGDPRSLKEAVTSDTGTTAAAETASRDASLRSEPDAPLPAIPESASPTEAVTTPPTQTASDAFDSLPTTAAAALDSPPPPPRVVEPIALKDMVHMSSVSDRIASMNDARKYYFETTTGLSSWLATMQADYPEYKLETSTFSKSILPYIPASRPPGPQADLSTATSPMPATTSFGHSHSHADSATPAALSQTASSSYSATATGGGGGGSASGVHRPTLGLGAGGLASSFHLPTTTSDLKHSGAKGKELLLAAGKAGKGLLSKGKSKFRGTGEKVFPY
ncbi:uncharacterized protein BROUX77_006188 [Berkeleyomyces rouxiae]|uniref:uncharacterized protein n=1 Tax=Berkeleyomyces rouxiae TaxID=2035830 RepID=UPI003B7C44EC